MLVKIVVEPTSKHIISFIFHSMSYYYLIFNIHLKQFDDLFFSLHNCFICLICHMCILAEISFIISGFRRLPVHLDQSIDITKHMHPLQQDIYCVLGNLFLSHSYTEPTRDFNVLYSICITLVCGVFIASQMFSICCRGARISNPQ